MIDDSLAAEKTGLWGRCYLDGRGMAPGSSPLAEGDQWIDQDRQRPRAVFPADGLRPPARDVFDRLPDERGGDVLRLVQSGRGGAVHAGGFPFRARRGGLPHPFLQRDERARPAHWWVGPLLNKGRGGRAGQRVRAVSDAHHASGHLRRPALRRVHAGGKRVGSDAGAFVDEHRRRRPALPARPGIGRTWNSTSTATGTGQRRAAAGRRRTRLLAGRADLAREGRERGRGGAGKKRRRGCTAGGFSRGWVCWKLPPATCRMPRRAFEQAARYYEDPADVVRVVLRRGASGWRRTARKTRRRANCSPPAARSTPVNPAAAALDEALAELAPAVAAQEALSLHFGTGPQT